MDESDKTVETTDIDKVNETVENDTVSDGTPETNHADETPVNVTETLSDDTVPTVEDVPPVSVDSNVSVTPVPTVPPIVEPKPTIKQNGDGYEPIFTSSENKIDDEEEEELTDRPVVELFVKAAVDKMKNGSCPICHRYFLILYVLREKGYIDLVVTTFLPENPPREILEFSNGKHFPVAKVHKGLDAKGVDMSGVTCDTIDELDSLIERFECPDMITRQQSSSVDKAERSFEGLYNKLNAFLKNKSDDPKPILRILEKIDDHLQMNGTKFLVSDTMTRADCYLLPVLQHIRVAGKAYKLFEIPTEMNDLWKYLGIAYDSTAFQESCPADRELIHHYLEKASNPAKINKRASLMNDGRTISVPSLLNGN